MNATTAPLPQGFEDLAPFVGYWAGETTQERIHARSMASMEEIRAFYDVMTERAEAAFNHVEQFPLHELPEDAAVLYRLVLALGQAHVAVEIHGQPRAPGTPYPNGIRIQRGPAPFG